MLCHPESRLVVSYALRNAKSPFAAGMTYVNEMPVQDEAHIAFGGERNSGIGRFNGEWAIQEFTTDHTIGFTRLEG